MVKTVEEGQKKKPNKLQWFLFTALIPAMFAIVVALIVFSFAGINVFEKAKEFGQKVPFLSGVLQGEETKTVEEWEMSILELEGEIKDRETLIGQLQKEMEAKDKEVEEAMLEVENLQQQIDDLIAIQEENKRAFKDIIKTYESMSAKKAAPVLTEMEDQEALEILTNINADSLAAILENLNPDVAAKYTEMLTSEANN